MSDEARLGKSRRRIRRAGRGAVTFLKEWGGAATLLIALLYTFPFDAFDRFTKWREKDVITARQALADAASVWIEQAKTSTQTTDARMADLLTRSFKIKLFNIVYTNREALLRAAPALKANEVSQLAAMMTSIGRIADALPYYEIAIEKAKEDKLNYANVVRDRAQTLFTMSPVQDIGKARNAYLEALALARNGQPPLADIVSRGAGDVGIDRGRLAVRAKPQR
jgi:tetratricopeptide (TPR) repeat protein